MQGTRLVLVRHGHSMAQQEGFAGGHEGCRGLSPLGRRQVDALAARLARTGELGRVDALWTSVMPRAVETGDRIAVALGDPPVTRDCDLCEFHVGEEIDGRPWHEIDEEWPRPTTEVDEHWRQSPTSESWAEMTTRVTSALDRIVDTHAGGTVVIATHGGVVGNVMVRMLHLSSRPHEDNRAHMDTENTSLTEFVHAPVAWLPTDDARWRLARYNDTAHLAGVT